MVRHRLCCLDRNNPNPIAKRNKGSQPSNFCAPMIACFVLPIAGLDARLPATGSWTSNDMHPNAHKKVGRSFHHRALYSLSVDRVQNAISDLEAHLIASLL